MPGTKNLDLRTAFLISLLVGTLGILFGSWSWIKYPLLLTLGLPVIAMIGYAVVGTSIDKTNVATQQFADSLYYLGFLFTLIALTVSLFTLGSEFDVPGIVGRFAVALVTTILGLASRILLTNFREGLEESIERTESALAQAAQSLRARLEQISQDMIGQTEVMKQTLGEALTRTSESLTENSERSAQALKSATNRLEDNMKSVGSALTESADQFVSAIRGEGEKGRDTVTDALERWERIATTLEATESGIDVWRQALDSARDSTEQFAQGIIDVGDAISMQRNLIEENGRAIAEQRRTIANELEAARAELSQLSGFLVEAARYISRELGR